MITKSLIALWAVTMTVGAFTGTIALMSTGGGSGYSVSRQLA